MGHGHGHGHGSHRAGADVEIARLPRLVLLGLLAVAFLLTGVGMATLWPDASAANAIRSQTSFAAPGVTYPSATVVSTSDTALTGTNDFTG